MESVATFLDMGGYGRFVWPAFAATVVVMAGLLFASRRSLKANEAMLAALQAEMTGAHSNLSHETYSMKHRA